MGRERRRLVVFSHPNHEISVYGSLARLRPDVVYLTDGGGEDRRAETREGLSRIGLLDRARFLDHAESSFYEALLERDVAFFRSVADQVRAVVDEVSADEVWCDAVELYNPVHDVSLPVVDAALAGRDARVVEVPLVWQRAGAEESYVVQRAPAARRADRVAFALGDPELRAKAAALDGVYSLLRRQMGPLLDVPLSDLAREEAMRRSASSPEVPEPDAEVALRYERRARELLRRGEIEREITLRDHYLPLAAALRASAPASAAR